MGGMTKKELAEMVSLEEEHRRTIIVASTDTGVRKFMTKSIKISKTKQKIYTYLHNNNPEKAQESLDKLKQIFIEDCADLTFNPEAMILAVADVADVNDSWIGGNAEGGRKMLDEMKKQLDWFQEGIEFIKKHKLT